MVRQPATRGNFAPHSVQRGLRRRFPLSDAKSRSTLTRAELVGRVAEALCREWCDDLDDQRLQDARFWEQFMHEARVAVDAYLDALDDAGYGIVSTAAAGNAETERANAGNGDAGREERS